MVRLVALLRPLAELLVALLGWAERRAVRDSAVAETRRRLEEAVRALQTAAEARRDVDRELDRDPSRLRADDGHRRPDPPA